jgi:hypothetical protein
MEFFLCKRVGISKKVMAAPAGVSFFHLDAWQVSAGYHVGKKIGLLLYPTQTNHHNFHTKRFCLIDIWICY